MRNWLSQMPISARTGTGSAGFLPRFAVKKTESAQWAGRPQKTGVMTGSIRSVCFGVVTAGLALGLGACSQTTYGTGTPVGMQTMEDLAGIADLGSPKQDSIKYSARPGIVPPPSGAPLPAPGSDQQAVASNWPNDPDARAKQFKAQVAAREKFCAEVNNKNLPECRDPGFRLPPSAQASAASRAPSQTLLNQNVKPGEAAHSTAAQDAQAKKLFADARGNVAVDENGKPIRRYLTDPPSDYRVPDPNAPTVIDNKPATKKKWKWPWQ